MNAFVSLLVASFIATEAEAPPEAPAEPAARVEAAAEPAWWAPLGLELGLETMVGLGTFVSNDKADDPYWASTLLLAPSWTVDEDLRLSLRFSLTYEWTYLVTPCRPASGPRPKGAPALDCSDAGGTGRRTHLDDLSIEASHGKLFEIEGVVLNGGAAIRFPTSRDSIAAENLFTLSGRLGVSRAFGPVTPHLGLRLAKFFPRAASPVADAADVSGDPPIGRCASFRDNDCIFLVGFVPSWRGGFELGATVQIPGVDGLSVSIDLGYSYTRKHGRDIDAASSPRLDASGRRVVDGVNDADSTSGTIELTYALTESWSAAFGVSSVQPAKTEDGSALRFPFYDFISPGNNYTAWYLGFGYSL